MLSARTEPTVNGVISPPAIYIHTNITHHYYELGHTGILHLCINPYPANVENRVSS